MTREETESSWGGEEDDGGDYNALRRYSSSMQKNKLFFSYHHRHPARDMLPCSILDMMLVVVAEEDAIAALDRTCYGPSFSSSRQLWSTIDDRRPARSEDDGLYYYHHHDHDNRPLVDIRSECQCCARNRALYVLPE
jgi:hypothetical protein